MQYKEYTPDYTVKYKRRRPWLFWVVASSAVVVIAAVTLFFAVPGLFADNSTEKKPGALHLDHPAHRVVSLAPSITETIFTLDADTVLVGVTRYCKYPPEADELPEVGGFLDPNIEALIGLQPDLVIMLKESGELVEKFERLGIATLVVNHQSIDGLLESYRQIGSALGVQERGDSLYAVQSGFLDTVREITAPALKLRTLISIGHSDEPGVIKNVYAVANDRFYSDLLQMAGGQNVIEDNPARYPIVTAESVIALNPEFIIDLFPGSPDQPVDHEYVQNQWRSLKDVRAVRQNRIVALDAQYLVIPGPRIVYVLRDFVQALHPELASQVNAALDAAGAAQ